MAQPRRARQALASRRVTTGAPVSVAPTSAVVTGTAPAGTTVRIEYGLSKSYGSSTPWTQADGRLTIALTDLTPEALYHYRLVAQSGEKGADRTLRPGRRDLAPPIPVPIVAAPVAGIISGTPPAAVGAAALAAGAAAQKSIATNTVQAVLGTLAAVALRRGRIVTQQVTAAYPASDIGEALAEEDRREIVFRKRVEQRLRASMKLAVGAKDPSARSAAIQSALKREERFAEMRSVASGERVLASAELQDLRSRSPQGAFWALGFRREHTPDCIAMAGKFWPWVVLNEVHPLLHVGCGCHLYSFGEAVSLGLMGPGGVMSDEDALRLAAPVIQHVREEAAEAQRKYGHLAEEESATEELLARAALMERGVDPSMLAAAPLATDPLPAPWSVVQEAEQHRDGAMVALFPAPATAKKLAVGGGEKADELHVTLAFLGKADQVDAKKARAAVEAWAKATPKLTGELSGIGHFDVGKDGIVTYRSVDLPDLPTPREKLVKALAAAGTPASTDHGFTPHMTIDYKVRRPAIEKKPISFDAVTLVLGEEREDFPFTGKASG